MATDPAVASAKSVRADPLRRLYTGLGARFPLRRIIDWHRRERLFLSFLARMPASPDPGGAPVAVVVQPWLLTDVPWYSLLLAFGIRQRGRRVVLIWDDIPWDIGIAADRMVNASIERVLGRLADTWQVERLSQHQGGGEAGTTSEQLKELAKLNVTWRFKGHAWPREGHAMQASLTSHFTRIAEAATAVLGKVSPTAVVVPGGIFSSSGVMRTVADGLGIRVATYDSGPGVMLAAGNGVAAWLADIPRAIEAIGSADDALVAEWAGRELAGRRGDSGAQSVFGELYQASVSQGDIPHGDVLIPLNQSYDTAALGRHRVFSSQVELLIETVRWVLDNSKATVVVRRHPIERRADLRSVDEYGDILEREFGPDPRVHYVAEDATVSTYELLTQARVVVPYTSTVGVEAALQGIPVVTESASYYSELGFVWSAGTAEEFFELLRRALAGELEVTETKRRDALRTYYTTQLCNFVLTPITPAAGDFAKWSAMDPADVLSAPEFSDIVEAVADGTPLAALRHRRRVCAASGAV